MNFEDPQFCPAKFDTIESKMKKNRMRKLIIIIKQLEKTKFE